MVLKLHPLHGLLVCSLLAASAVTASAHCCHDERSLGIAEQSTFRPGLHGLGEGIPDDAEQADAPTIGGGLRRGPGSLGNGGMGSLGGGGLGSMRGDGLGSYGAGSIGELGPGGLGSLRGTGLGPQAPRPR